MSEFKKKVIKTVSLVPYSKVASYGQVALIIGFPRGARQVGWILNSTEGNSNVNIPWWRIVNNKGKISIKGTKYNDARLQKKLLISEGLDVDDNLEFDIERYRWRPKKEDLLGLSLEDEYVQMVIEKYQI